MRTNWKRKQPSSLIEAIRYCKDHAIERKRLSVERVAELLGVSADVLYKWLANGRLPAIYIAPFEYICGIDFISRYLAASNNRILVDIPTVAMSNEKHTHVLQESTATAISSLMKFYKGKVNKEETLMLIQTALESFASHRANVENYESPQLDFGGYQHG